MTRISGVILGFVICLGLVTSPWSQAASHLTKTDIQIDQVPFRVEWALTPLQQQQGLQYRTRLGAHDGMVFPYAQPQKLVFWMKDCNIPLDILYFRQGTLIDYVDSAPPCHLTTCPFYPAHQLSDLVIELKAGTRQRYQFASGVTHVILPAVAPSSPQKAP